MPHTAEGRPWFGGGVVNVRRNQSRRKRKHKVCLWRAMPENGIIRSRGLNQTGEVKNEHSFEIQTLDSHPVLLDGPWPHHWSDTPQACGRSTFGHPAGGRG